MGTQPSPGIRSLKWGSVVLTTGERFKDVKLYPGGAREWDWSETGTRHSPGIQLADVDELLEHGARIVILSLGQARRLEVPTETVRSLRHRGIEVQILETPQAVEAYNELRLTEPVGALIHSTC